MAPKFKVAVVGGGGNVGAASAFALVAMQVPVDIMLIDVNEKLAQGQALDISDASHLSPARCRHACFQEGGQADVIIITAGARQNPGESRNNLIQRNYKIMKSIVQSMSPIKPTAVILVVSNPVDLLTSIVQDVSGHPRNMVIGSGTFLDSGRLRKYLSGILRVSSSSIHASMLGEHGDSQFVGWSSASIGGHPILEQPGMEKVNSEEIQKIIADKAYNIIEAKGSTYYGVGMHVAVLTKCILFNELKVFPISNYVAKYRTYMSAPAVLGSNGCITLPVALDERESELMETAANTMKELLASIPHDDD